METTLAVTYTPLYKDTEPQAVCQYQTVEFRNQQGQIETSLGIVFCRQTDMWECIYPGTFPGHYSNQGFQTKENAAQELLQFHQQDQHTMNHTTVIVNSGIQGSNFDHLAGIQLQQYEILSAFMLSAVGGSIAAVVITFLINLFLDLYATGRSHFRVTKFRKANPIIGIACGSIITFYCFWKLYLQFA